MTDTADHKVKPYSPSAEYRYFLYDPNDGHTFYRTPEERDIAAESLIKEYLSDGEWNEEVVGIYAGEATHQVNEVERLERVGQLDDDGYDENDEYWGDSDIECKCNYGLQPLAQSAPVEPGRVERLPDRKPYPTPPAEGEVHLLAAWMYRLADERTRSRRRGIRPHPSALTRTGAAIQQQAAVIQQQAAELAECREALRRVRRWGSTFGSPYSSAVAMGVMDWIDAGMTGPLPAMPEYLEGRHHV